MTVPLNTGRFIYIDENGVVFSVSAFLALSGLPNDARLRAIIIEELREVWPEIRILEELN
jgi:hypothetical protein